MQTPVDSDGSVRAAARERARREGSSRGRAVSSVASRGIRGEGPVRGSRGVPHFAPPPVQEEHSVTLDLIESHRDGDELIPLG